MMRLIPVFFCLFILLSCRKSESDFIWERSYGKGEALFLKTSADSGFIAAGRIGGNPYFIRLDKNRNKIIDVTATNSGLFSSVWFDTSGYIAGGSTNGKMLLMRFSPQGNILWEKSIDAGFNIDYSNLFNTGNGNFLAVGTASESSGSGPSGLLFIRFNVTGQVISENKSTVTDYISARDAVIDNAGNIFLALTRKTVTGKSKASVAEYNELFQKIWETDLYNNPDFGAACHSIELDASKNIYVSGFTEVSSKDGILSNSFIASLSSSGSVKWKKYLENSNSGSALSFNYSGDILMLNRNCFIINILTPAPSEAIDAGRIRMFSICDPNNSDALGADMDINYDRNILVAGSQGESFYVALKSTQ